MYLKINARKLKKTFAALISFTALLLCSWYVFNRLDEAKEPNEIIQGTINLVNYCSVSDKSFMIMSIPKGPRAFFGGNKVTIRAPRGQKMQLVSSTRYPDFSYEGPIISLSQENTVIADCESKGSSRLEGLKGNF